MTERACPAKFSKSPGIVINYRQDGYTSHETCSLRPNTDETELFNYRQEGDTLHESSPDEGKLLEGLVINYQQEGDTVCELRTSSSDENEPKGILPYQLDQAIKFHDIRHL